MVDFGWVSYFIFFCLRRARTFATCVDLWFFGFLVFCHGMDFSYRVRAQAFLGAFASNAGFVN